MWNLLRGKPRTKHDELKQLMLDEDYHGPEINSMIDQDPQIFFVLVDLMKDKDPGVRAEAVATLCHATYGDQKGFYLKQVHATAAPLVLSLLRDPSPKVRAEAAHNISTIDDEAWPAFLISATPVLLQLLEDSHPEVQQSAGWSLMMAARGVVKNDPRTALHLVSKLTCHKNVKVRRQVWFTEIHVQSFEAVRSELIALLHPLTKDQDERVREQAIGSIKLWE